VPTTETRQIEFFLPADASQRGTSPPHACARRAIHPDSLFWVTEDGELVEYPGVSCGAYTGTKVDADHGFGDDLSEAEDEFARADCAKGPVRVARREALHVHRSPSDPPVSLHGFEHLARGHSTHLCLPPHRPRKASTSFFPSKCFQVDHAASACD
jgi:hypothetical protein